MPLPLFNSLSLLATALRIKVHTLSHPVGVAATYLTRLLQCIAAAAKSLQDIFMVNSSLSGLWPTSQASQN